MTIEELAETMKRLKQLRASANAMLANSAYTLKAELKQMERLTAEIKRHDVYVEAGIITTDESALHQDDIKREKRLLHRLYEIRRTTARGLMRQIEEDLDEIEGGKVAEQT